MEATGTRLEVGARVLTTDRPYDEVTAMLKPRTLGVDTGLRELLTSDGLKTINVAAVALVEPFTTRKRPIGFAPAGGRT